MASPGHKCHLLTNTWAPAVVQVWNDHFFDCWWLIEICLLSHWKPWAKIWNGIRWHSNMHMECIFVSAMSLIKIEPLVPIHHSLCAIQVLLKFFLGWYLKLWKLIVLFNSLSPDNINITIWNHHNHRTLFMLDQVMACCQMAPGHYIVPGPMFQWSTMEQFHRLCPRYQSFKSIWKYLI